MKKLIAILLAACMVLGLCACGGTSSGGSDAELNADGRYPSITYAINQNIQNLLPTAGTSNPKVYFYTNLYETLFDFDENQNLTPNLAQSYEIIDDTTWEIKLFETITDSAGNPITASDVVFSTDWLINAGEALNYDLFDYIEVVDDYTLRYHWTSKPASISDVEFPLGRTFVFAEAAFDETTFATAPVGTGNYVVSSFTTGAELVLTYNENYWADNTTEDVSHRLAYHNAMVEQVTFKIVTDSSTAQISLQNGTIDYCDYIRPLALDTFESDEKYDVATSVSADYTFMCYNMSGESVLSDDLNLRLAIAYAIDSDTIAAGLPGSYTAMTTYGTPYFSDYDASWEDEETYANTYNLELAQEYLAQSNYNGETIKIMCKSSEEDKSGVTYILSMLQHLGVNVEMSSVDNSTFSTDTSVNTAWDLLYFSGMSGKDLVSSWKLACSAVNGDDGSLGFITDQELFDLYATATADETHDSEHMKAVIDWVFVNCVLYPVVYGMSARVYDNTKISSLYYREGYVTITASTFAGQEENTDPEYVSCQIGETPVADVSSVAGTYTFTDAGMDMGTGTCEYTIELSADGTYRVDCVNCFSEEVYWTGTFSLNGDAVVMAAPEAGVEGSMDRCLNSGWAEEDGVGTITWYISGTTITPADYALTLTFVEIADMGEAAYTGYFYGDGTYHIDCNNYFGEDIYLEGTYTIDGDKLVCSASAVQGSMDKLLNGFDADSDNPAITWVNNGDGTMIPDGYTGEVGTIEGGDDSESGDDEGNESTEMPTYDGFDEFDWVEESAVGDMTWGLYILNSGTDDDGNETGYYILYCNNPFMGELEYRGTFVKSGATIVCSAPDEANNEVIGDFWAEDGTSTWTISGAGAVAPEM
ncbi:MAG: ABC transporter substrate-binding protein [Firmicutes bacterium]|nr:ABC transporter substrate-binding protein [Bacillota bacterium]